MSDVVIRDAGPDDLGTVVAMYADDQLGASREDAADPLPPAYLQAFEAIRADPRHRLVVAEQGGEVVGTLQLSFLPNLVLRGGERAQIEAVRVRADRRRGGIGEAMIDWAIAQARARGCRLVQLTTDAQREEARRFYERRGFRPTHLGMKLRLEDGPPPVSP